MQKYLKWSFYSILVGIMSGIAAAIFLISLNWVTNYRDQNHWLLYLLPLAGFFIGYCYYKYGKNSAAGTGLILEEIHDPKHILPFRMAPFVLIGTVLTHLFGGSAGREGTAVQMGSTLADQLSRLFKMDAQERKILLVAGAGAGFSAAIGAPWAGTIFGMEVIQIGRLRLFALFECFVSSFVAFYTCRLLGAPHSHFPALQSVEFHLSTFGFVALAGLAFGVSANIFIRITHVIEHLQKKYIQNPALRPLLAGFVLLGLYMIPGNYRFAGLGIGYIQQSFAHSALWSDPWLKIIFTAITVGSGYKGGEFIPLVFIGATLGSFMATLMPVSAALITALGFAAVFGAAANTPIACALMACEIFGWQIAPYAFLCCGIAYFMTGHLGIYKNQKIIHTKKDQLLRLLKFKF